MKIKVVMENDGGQKMYCIIRECVCMYKCGNRLNILFGSIFVLYQNIYLYIIKFNYTLSECNEKKSPTTTYKFDIWARVHPTL